MRLLAECLLLFALLFFEEIFVKESPTNLIVLPFQGKEQ